MSDSIPLSPSFVSISCTANTSSSDDLDDTPLSPKVRFDQDCVLIPDPIPSSRLPRLVTKSYSLPLWKRKQREPSIVSDTEDDTNDEHVVFKVSVPRSVHSISALQSIQLPTVFSITTASPLNHALHPDPILSTSLSSHAWFIRTNPSRPALSLHLPYPRPARPALGARPCHLLCSPRTRSLFPSVPVAPNATLPSTNA